MKLRIYILLWLCTLQVPPSVMAADCDPFELLWANTLTPVTEGASRELFYSQAANQPVSYEIWLPPSYDPSNSERRFPTVYWLHGIGGNQDSGSKFWSRIDAALADGRTPEMIVVGVNGLCNKIRRPDLALQLSCKALAKILIEFNKKQAKYRNRY